MVGAFFTFFSLFSVSSLSSTSKDSGVKRIVSEDEEESKPTNLDDITLSDNSLSSNVYPITK